MKILRSLFQGLKISLSQLWKDSLSWSIAEVSFINWKESVYQIISTRKQNKKIGLPEDLIVKIMIDLANALILMHL